MTFGWIARFLKDADHDIIGPDFACMFCISTWVYNMMSDITGMLMSSRNVTHPMERSKLVQNKYMKCTEKKIFFCMTPSC